MQSKRLTEQSVVGRLLHERGYTQAAISTWLGVSKSEASRIAKGYLPPREQQVKLARHLKTSTDVLFPHRNGDSK